MSIQEQLEFLPYLIRIAERERLHEEYLYWLQVWESLQKIKDLTEARGNKVDDEDRGFFRLFQHSYELQMKAIEIYKLRLRRHAKPTPEGDATLVYSTTVHNNVRTLTNGKANGRDS